MIKDIIILIIGFIILIKGADIFVSGSSGLASNFKMPKMLIGLTIVAFGTSSPEFAVSVSSLIMGNKDMVLGNVIGSNILNVLLILGVASLVHPLTVKDNTVKKELPITILFTTLFSVLLTDHLFDKTLTNTFTRSDGIVLTLFFLIFIYYLINMMKKTKKEAKTEEKMPIIKSITYTILGIIAIIFGSKFVVNGSSNIAATLGVTERIISLTIIALGTSLPELVTSVVATKKGEYDIAIGNVVGSNIFNIGIVIGIPVALIGSIGNITVDFVDLIMMIGSSVLLFMFAFKDYKISKKEGAVFLLLFTLYYTYIIFG
ncbi:MAG: calcium/sodium antiporter [Bacilli bacterium]|nr:calcium/sodium antiporter [Bacilli bacterium]